MSFQDKIFDALDCNGRNINDFRFKVTKLNNGFELEFGQMYESPLLINFQTLTALSKLVGTDQINVDDFSMGGCETCDYGSDYGHRIEILNPTLNVDELEKLVS